MRNLDRMLKNRDITLLTKVRLVKDVVFPGVKYGCDSWTIKKAQHQRTDASELWWWRRLLRVPWTARRSKSVHPEENQPWIFIVKTDAEAKAPILWPPHAKSWFIGKDSDAGKNWSQRRRGQPRMRWLGSIANSMDMNLSKLWKIVKDRKPGVIESTGWQRVGHNLVIEQH